MINSLLLVLSNKIYAEDLVDGLMRFVRELDENVQLDLLNRNRLGYLVGGTLSTFHFNQIELLAKDGRINYNIDY